MTDNASNFPWESMTDHDRILWLLSRMALNEEQIEAMSKTITYALPLIADDGARADLMELLTDEALAVPSGSLAGQFYWQILGLLRASDDAEQSGSWL